ELLEQHQRGPLRHNPKYNQPFGKGWNLASTYEGRKSFHVWAEELNGIQAAATLEVPYATVNEAEVTPDSARRFGRDLALALRLYLDRGRTAAGARPDKTTDSAQRAVAGKHSAGDHWAYRPVAPAPIPAVH